MIAALAVAANSLGFLGTVAVEPTPRPLATAAVPTYAPQQQPVYAPVAQPPAPPAPTSAPPEPTLLPAGLVVGASVSGDGVSVNASLGNGAPSAAVDALPEPGQPGFVESFATPAPLAPGNPFVGCLVASCDPNRARPLPEPGEAGFVESFREP